MMIDSPSDSVLLVKYISGAGYCARRRAVELIKAGQVKVNGHVVIEPWHPVKKGAVVHVGKTHVFQAPKEYILLNKPLGFVTTMADEQDRASVAMLIKNASSYRLFPVGRLDKETRGLLLFTNDGELANRLSHPRFKVEKVYCAILDKPVEYEHIQALMKGFRTREGRLRADSISYMPGKNKNVVKVYIHSGKNRIVRRMFEHFGYEVQKLDRVRYAGLTQKGMAVGTWRKLSKNEIQELESLAQKGSE